jgi:DNA-binding transcriptional ArsR family regulator
MNSKNIYEIQARLCQAMGYALRIEIIHFLREGAKTAGEIMQETGCEQGAISRHLSILQRAGIIAVSRQGREHSYQIANPKITLACDLIRQVLAEQAAQQADLAQKL